MRFENYAFRLFTTYCKTLHSHCCDDWEEGLLTLPGCGLRGAERWQAVIAGSTLNGASAQPLYPRGER